MTDFSSPHVLAIAVDFNLAGIAKGMTGMVLPTGCPCRKFNRAGS